MPDQPGPDTYVSLVSEGTLSGPALTELLRAVLERGACFRFLATGHSMSPFIRDGDVITLEPLAERAARLGDVVAFIHPRSERLVVHRAIGRRPGLVLIRGDNSPQPDGWVETARVLARAVKIERRGARVHLGLGPERLLIALLARLGSPADLVRALWRLLRPIVRRHRP